MAGEVDPPFLTVGGLLPYVKRGPAGFAKEVGGWVMVGQIPNPAAQWSYRTEGLKTARAVRAPTGEVEAMLDEGWAAFVLKKKEGAKFADTVFVGRATNNDVTIPHTSVSKLHARVKSGEGSLLFSDAGSSNGTMINGDAIPAGVDVVVGHGDLVRFGSVVFQVFEPRRLCSVLERFGVQR